MSDISTAKHAAGSKSSGPKHASNLEQFNRSRRFRTLFATLGASCTVVLLLACYFAIPSFSSSDDESSYETVAMVATKGRDVVKAQATSSSDVLVRQGELNSESDEPSIESDSTEQDDLAFEDDSSSPDDDSANIDAPEAASTSEPENEDVEAHTDENAASPDDTEDTVVADEAAQQDNQATEQSNASEEAEESKESEPSDSGAASLQGIVTEKLEEERPVQDEEAAAFFETVLENGAPIASEDVKKLADSPVAYTDSVQPRLQQGILDSGCEIMSLAMALDSMGFSFDPIVIADNYLDFEGGMAEGFVGNPYDGGGGFPAGITKAANTYLIDNNSEFRAYDLTGNSFDTIIGLVERGYPVLIWTTIDFSDPYFHDVYEGGYQWYGNEHCVLLCGVGEDTVIVCDPLEGKIERDTARFREIFEQCGSMAVYVR